LALEDSICKKRESTHGKQDEEGYSKRVPNEIVDDWLSK
jgi:hypothetical protein